MKRAEVARQTAIRSRLLDEGRKLLRNQEWSAAVSKLFAADREAPLEPGDLEALASAAQLVGKETETLDLLNRAHQGFLARDDSRSAARCAYWLGFNLLMRGEPAQSSGWFSRAGRLLDGEPACAEQGYLFLPVGYREIHGGDATKAYKAFAQAGAIGKRFFDKDLMTLSLQGQGRALIRQGEIRRGVALLDEAMVAVTAGEVSSLIAGGIYCSVIEACDEMYDLGRAHEWTSALEQWCKTHPDVLSYRGHCLVHRAEILQICGAWPEALIQAQTARDALSTPPPKPAVGAAIYRVAEIHRLRGEFTEAEDAYRQSSQWQRIPQAGFALLRLAQGQIEAANAAIRHAAAEIKDGPGRAKLLEAYVEIALTTNDVKAARAAADELDQIAISHGAPYLRALAGKANGAVLLSEQKEQGALSALRASWTLWCDLDAPYEAARTRVLMARAFRELHDEETALLELNAARDVFRQLGAATDLAGVETLMKHRARIASGVLTSREVQVVQLVAAAMTNKRIATRLAISEKTVARHLSNIFTKLDLSSRSAVTAYAYQRKLV